MAVKEGSDSDENLSDVEDLNHHKDNDHTAVAAAAVAAESSVLSPDGSSSSPPSEQPPVLQPFDHNPGEVYPIAEEEEEAASPTAPDGVTSLRRRARLNSGWIGGRQKERDVLCTAVKKNLLSMFHFIFLGVMERWSLFTPACCFFFSASFL